jgi:hypothetical protein
MLNFVPFNQTPTLSISITFFENWYQC